MMLNMIEIGSENVGLLVIVVYGLLGLGKNLGGIVWCLVESGWWVVLVDMCNYGDSFYDFDYSYVVLVDDLVSVIEVKGSLVDVLGYFMGGKVVMMLVLMYFDLVCRFMVLDIVFYVYSYM